MPATAKGPAKWWQGIGHDRPFILGREDAVLIGVQGQWTAVTSPPTTQKVPVRLHAALCVETGHDMDDGGDAAMLQSWQEGSDQPGAFVEPPRSLGRSGFAASEGVQDCEDMGLLLTHGYPVVGRYADRQGSSLA